MSLPGTETKTLSAEEIKEAFLKVCSDPTFAFGGPNVASLYERTVGKQILS
jgi:hypothetical protein